MRLSLIMVVAMYAPLCAVSSHSVDWSAANRVIEEAIDDGVFPGATWSVFPIAGDVASMGSKTRNGRVPAFPPWRLGAGHTCYPGDDTRPGSDTGPCGTANPSTTRYDLASLTKVTVTTTLSMLLQQSGVLDLESRVFATDGALGAPFGGQGKDTITAEDLLLHRAGFDPDPIPNYWSSSFPCKFNGPPFEHPPLSRECAVNITESLAVQDLRNPPRTKYVYSDLSMISMANVVGALAAERGLLDDHVRNGCASWCPCPLHAARSSRAAGRVGDDDDDDAIALAAERICLFAGLASKWIIEPLKLSRTGFASPALPADECAPAWRDNVYQKRLIRGFVSDGNAYASGGVQGHAGLFSTAEEVEAIVKAIAGAGASAAGEGILGLRAATVERFFTVADPAFSSRALGWDTNASPHGGSNCGTLSSGETITHTGYTGTLICIDTARSVGVVLLTNRAYPDDGSKPEISKVRSAFTTAVASALDAWSDAHSGSEDGSGDGAKDGKDGGDGGRGGGGDGGATPRIGRVVFGIVLAAVVIGGAVAGFFGWRRYRAIKQRERERERGVGLVDRSFASFRAMDDDDVGFDFDDEEDDYHPGY